MRIHNPSVYEGKFEFSGLATDLPVGKKVIVTSPERKWFAQIEKRADGQVVAK